MVENPFDSEAAARLYAEGRPDYSAIAGPILEQLAAGDRPLDRAVDIACGTGISTRMLVPIAPAIVGVDASAAMLGHVAPLPNAGYIRGSAENIPLGDDTADLITVGSAFHWFDQSRFLAEADRIARPAARLVVHNHWFVGEMQGRPDFARWLAEVHTLAFPTPPRHRTWRPPHDLDMWKHSAWQTYEHTVEMTRSMLASYLMSQSNVQVVIARGERPEAEIRQSLLESLVAFFAGERTLGIGFGGYVACHHRAEPSAR